MMILGVEASDDVVTNPVQLQVLSKPPMMGVAGTKVWKIKANEDAAPGTATLFHVIKARPWEEPGNHVDEIKFSLIVV